MMRDRLLAMREEVLRAHGADPEADEWPSMPAPIINLVHALNRAILACGY